MTQERIMFSNSTPSEPHLSPAATMSDVTPSSHVLLEVKTEEEKLKHTVKTEEEKVKHTHRFKLEDQIFVIQQK